MTVRRHVEILRKLRVTDAASCAHADRTRGGVGGGGRPGGRRVIGDVATSRCCWRGSVGRWRAARSVCVRPARQRGHRGRRTASTWRLRHARDLRRGWQRLARARRSALAGLICTSRRWRRARLWIASGDLVDPADDVGAEAERASTSRRCSMVLARRTRARAPPRRVPPGSRSWPPTARDLLSRRRH